ncbi:Regulatory protein TetR [Chitinophaga sp. 180180018-2]|nr:Regulatory protein TetR [Chitinophaga sp. 212800010-3]
MLTYLCGEMRYRDENKIQAIRDSAIEMIAKDGLENFGINRLAKSAGVSPATIYIYYKDKEDLLTSISVEEAQKMVRATMKGCHSGMPFREWLWVQWKNRAAFGMDNHSVAGFFEQLRNSSYRDKMLETISEEFKHAMGAYLENAVKSGEVNWVPVEVFWAVAFAPLYTLVKFHNEGRNIDGSPFKLTESIMKAAFECIIKGMLK